MLIDLRKVGMEKGQQYETIITTLDKNGKTNAAPFGVRVLEKDKVLLRIFEGGNTIKNIKEKEEFIVNICSNPLMLTLSTINTIPESFLTKIQKEESELAYITNTDAYFICEVRSIKTGIKKDDPIRPTETNYIKADVNELNILNPCTKAINRGMHVLIESLVNYSRINIVNPEKQEFYIKRLLEAKRIIKKVGNQEEKEAINILIEDLRKQNYEI